MAFTFEMPRTLLRLANEEADMPSRIRDALFFMVVGIGLLVLLYVILDIGTAKV